MDEISIIMLRTVFLPPGSPGVGVINDISADVREAEVNCAEGKIHCRGEADLLVDYISFAVNEENGTADYMPGGGKPWQAFISLPFVFNEDVALGKSSAMEIEVDHVKWFIISPRALELELSLKIFGEGLAVEDTGDTMPPDQQTDNLFSPIGRSFQTVPESLSQENMIGGWQMVGLEKTNGEDRHEEDLYESDVHEAHGKDMHDAEDQENVSVPVQRQWGMDNADGSLSDKTDNEEIPYSDEKGNEKTIASPFPEFVRELSDQIEDPIVVEEVCECEQDMLDSEPIAPPPSLDEQSPSEVTEDQSEDHEAAKEESQPKIPEVKIKIFLGGKEMSQDSDLSEGDNQEDNTVANNEENKEAAEEMDLSDSATCEEDDSVDAVVDETPAGEITQEHEQVWQEIITEKDQDQADPGQIQITGDVHSRQEAQLSEQCIEPAAILSDEEQKAGKNKTAQDNKQPLSGSKVTQSPSEREQMSMGEQEQVQDTDITRDRVSQAQRKKRAKRMVGIPNLQIDNLSDDGGYKIKIRK